MQKLLKNNIFQSYNYCLKHICLIQRHYQNQARFQNITFFKIHDIALLNVYSHNAYLKLLIHKQFPNVL